jgi:hypothetical protein
MHESWEENFSKEEQWTKINTDRKRSSYIEKYCFEKSQNCCCTGDRIAELNIHLEDPVSTKTVRRELHKSNIHGSAAIAEPLIGGSNTQMLKRRCLDHKTRTSDNWKRARDMVRRVVLQAVPYIGKSSRLEDTQGSLQSGMHAWYQQ